MKLRSLGIFSVIPLAAALLIPSAASAVTIVDWANLTNASAGIVSGTVDGVGVQYSGSYSFAQTNGAGTNYWLPDNYSQGLVTPLPDSDVIALNDGGTKTITFTSPVTNVFLAFNSWNGNHVTFDRPFTIISQGGSYWGSGTFAPFGGNTGFDGIGEVVGVLEFSGTFSSLSFTDSSENWHGIQIGLDGSRTTVPEPITLSLFWAGLAGAVAARRRKKKA